MAEEIVDRLKAEGQLIRNTGTNSIRAVRIQLDRFEEIFETISENISAQTQMMASMLDVSADQLKISEETAEREEARRQREELAEDQTTTPSPDTTRDDLPDKKTRESRGLFDLLRGGTGFLNKLLMGALFAGGVYALGNVFKGFIDAKIGESEFTKGLASAINWTAIGSIFGLKFGLLLGAGNILSNIFDLPEVTKKIGDAFGKEFTDNQAEGIGTALGAALTAAWLKKGGLRFKIIGALIVATELLGNNMKDWLIDQAGVNPDWANTTVDVATLGIQGALAGLGIAGVVGMAAIPALIAGGVAGLAVGIGIAAKKWLDKKAKTELEGFNAALDKAFESGNPQDVLDAMIAKNRAAAAAERASVQAQDNYEREIQTRKAELQSAMERAAAQEIEGEGLVTRKLGQIQAAEDFKSGASKYNSLITALGAIARSDITQDIAKDLGKEGLSSFLEQTLDEIIRNNPDLRTDNETREKVISKVLSDYSFRRGTKGFQDFGDASFAILHGREAVVPEETPAGRFLNQYFTNEWMPKMAPSSDLADRVSTAAGGIINMPVIVNNSPTVAPVVNNVQGGPNVTSTNVFGSGGSRSGTFGLSNAIN